MLKCSSLKSSKDAARRERQRWRNEEEKHQATVERLHDFDPRLIFMRQSEDAMQMWHRGQFSQFRIDLSHLDRQVISP